MKMGQGFTLSTRDCIKIMLACGVLQIAAYYFAGMWASPGKQIAVPQLDTPLYCESARQIAEGMPYIYTPGDRPSTGCTSHVYPFLLAALYKAGATGDALLTAGFALNALFYLIFLANWGVIAGRMTTSPRGKIAACALLALNGQAAFCALSQSDMGLFMAVSSGIFAALLAGRTGWLVLLLVLAPWCRPEGAMFAVLFTGALVIRRLFLRQRVARSEWAAAGLAVLSTIGMFAFNDWLTGTMQFQSVYGKGYFKQYSFMAAVNLALQDAVRMLRELFLGLPEAMPRESFFIPLLGALFAWLGVLARPWRKEGSWKELWWLSACAGGVAVVASSGWQNSNVDRYLVWLLPVWLIYMAEGAEWVAGRFPQRACRALPLLVVAGFQAAGAVMLATLFYSNCLLSQQHYDFAKDSNVRLPVGSSVGGEDCTAAYGMPGHRMVHLSGIYSPELLTFNPICNLERLKHQPGLRFDYWEFLSEQAVFCSAKIERLCGPMIALGLDGTNVRRACWDGLDRARLPVSGEIQALSNVWRLEDRLDVGYPEDEKRCQYTTYSRFHGSEFEPFGVAGLTGTNELFEIGRVVLGSDSFTVRLRPYCPVRVVLRTVAQVETGVCTGARWARKTFTMDSPLKLAVHAHGSEVGAYTLPLSTNATEFSEIQFTVPAVAIREPVTRLTLYGDHAALAYWFYQPVP